MDGVFYVVISCDEISVFPAAAVVVRSAVVTDVVNFLLLINSLPHREAKYYS